MPTRTASRTKVRAVLLFLLLAAPGVAAAATFDNDLLADIAVFRPGTSMWYISQSSDGAVKGERWGDATDVPVPADYDGDGKTDVAVFRPGVSAGQAMWYIKRSSDGAVVAVQWGDSSDKPVPGDYDGDRKTDIAVFRPGASAGTGMWYIRQSTDNSVKAEQWGDGNSSDVPVPEDYDGDGKTDIAVFRPGVSAGQAMWYVKRSSDGGVVAQQWGDPSDRPVPGDYDGDRKADIAVFRPGASAGTGMWYIRQSSDSGVKAEQWGDGNSMDVAVPADYDGDGKTDIAVFRPGVSAGETMWYIKRSSDGVVVARQWGDPTDKPVLVARSPSAPGGPFDIRNYFTLQLGDLAVFQDNSLRIMMRTERFPDVPYPMYLLRSFQQWGYSWEELWYFDSSDNLAKQYGRYEVSPYEGKSARVLYRYVPPRVVGSSAMRIGDTFTTPHVVVNTNTGDNTADTFSASIAAVESVTTAAGTFDNCIRYPGSDSYGNWTVWLCPRVGMIKETGGNGGAVYIRLADNTVYGSPPALAVDNVSGMYDFEVNLPASGGGRWEQNIYNVVHNTNDNLTITRYRPNGTQSPRAGTLSGSEFTMTGSTPQGPVTFQGVFTPDARSMAGMWWYDNVASVKYASAGRLISPVVRFNDDEDIVRYTTPADNAFVRHAYVYPESYNGFPQTSRRDVYYGLDNSAPRVAQSWWTRWDGLYLVGDSEAGGPITPMMVLPDRFTQNAVYTNYSLGGGNFRTIRVDQVGGQTAPMGWFPLALRINIQDNATLSRYSWIAPGVAAEIRFEEPEGTNQLASSRIGGASFGNRPTATPFPFLAGSYAFGNHLTLNDASNGAKSYFLQIGIKTPAMGMVTDPTPIQDVKVRAWPSMTEIPLTGSPFLYYSNFDNDPDGTGGTPPNPAFFSEIEGYLNLSLGALQPGFYQAVITDNTGQRQTAWLFHDAETETGKVDNSSMSFASNPDNSVTFNWGTPSPAPNASRHILRLYVLSTVDGNGDGQQDVLFMANLPATATSYTMPAGAAAKLRGVASLVWYIQVREQANYVVNPDATTANYFIYRNSGQRAAFYLSP